MSIIVALDIWCDVCSGCAGYSSSFDPKFVNRRRALLKKAKRAGWKRAIVNGRAKDTCPGCVADATTSSPTN